MSLPDPVVRQRAVAAVRARNDDWLDRYARLLVALDLVLLGITGIVAVLARFGLEEDRQSRASVEGTPYLVVAGLLALGWVVVLGFSRCYETRFLGSGSEEYRRVTNASLRVTATVALVAFALKLDVSRGFVAVFLLLGTFLLLLGRYAARARLRAGRRQGRWTQRVLVVGHERQVLELADEMSRDPASGLTVVGACIPGRADGRPLRTATGAELPVFGSLADVTGALVALGADTVAVAASPEITGEAMRRLSYDLEGTGVDLLVAPALTNVTGTRLSIRPTAGLPLLHLDEPELGGSRQLVKRLFDLVVASALLVVLAPLLLALVVVVRLSSRGPAIFTQQRVGRRGRPFRLYKLRTMHVGAEQQLRDLRSLNEHDGVLFKVRRDPRVTRVGRLLRRYSLDELPQLVNVVLGQMSLVGPRPPLASEVERYQGHAHRRLLVKPGITGLWQVSGRSDLSWEDTVRLDLQYVENWSLALDMVVLARTALAVLRGRGAY